MIRDPEMLDQLLSTIRDFVKNELVPLEHEVEENNAIPEHIVEQMKELGLFGLTIPEEYGGLGITMEEEILVAMELGHTSAAFRSLIGTNNGIGSSGIIIDGTEEQKTEIFTALCHGRNYWFILFDRTGFRLRRCCFKNQCSQRRRLLYFKRN